MARLPERDRIAVILLTAKREVHDRVTGLRLGADDYIPKPFAPSELLARVDAVLRRIDPRAGDYGPRYAFYSDTTTVPVHVRRLREKIEEDASDPRWVETVWGVGYRLQPCAA